METRRLFVFLLFLLLTLVLAEGVVGTAALAKDSRINHIVAWALPVQQDGESPV
jgi:hypothetical protein